MDLKLPVSRDASNVATFVETNLCPAINNPLRTTCRILGVNGKTDALEAVKLDPAVLEAQVTVDAKTIANDSKEQIVADKEKEAVASSSSKAFEDMVSQHEAALLSLTPVQLEMLMKYADILRRQRMTTRKYKECVFCKNNGKSLYWYTSHTLKDNRGRVQCPVLRSFRCPQCGATGDHAHTIKYCPQLVHTDVRSSAF